MRPLVAFALVAAFLIALVPRAAADGGPDYWAVTGIAAGGVLGIHAGPSLAAASLGTVPWNGRRLANLGCTHEPTYQEWLAMSEEERKRAAERRWCRIRYDGITGWVRGKFLRED
ncbi:MAG TPA: SH3 domain-containing protein [Xanthobacteraceae bacterium]|nr:SH3 domain-containing protein [Xanthobacteraceae bacterium]